MATDSSHPESLLSEAISPKPHVLPWANQPQGWVTLPLVLGKHPAGTHHSW